MTKCQAIPLIAVETERADGQHALEAATAELLDRVEPRSTETIDKVFAATRASVLEHVGGTWSPAQHVAGVIQPPTRTAP